VITTRRFTRPPLIWIVPKNYIEANAQKANNLRTENQKLKMTSKLPKLLDAATSNICRLGPGIQYPVQN
jgi:hypothetical protein